MSATVTYKNSTLTTVINETRILETAGKYLEDDITIVDIGGSDAIDGDPLEYGDTSFPIVGIGRVGSMTLYPEYNSIVDSGRADYMVLAE